MEYHWSIYSTPRVIGIIVITVIMCTFGVLHYLERKKKESKEKISQ